MISVFSETSVEIGAGFFKRALAWFASLTQTKPNPPKPDAAKDRGMQVVREFEISRRLRLPHILVMLAALVAIVIALWQLQRGEDGLVIVSASADGIPVTVFRKAQGGEAPLVVITHGFAGSQRLMQPFAKRLRAMAMSRSHSISRAMAETQRR